MVFNKGKGRQYFKNCRGLSPFGIQVIIPNVCATDNSPIENPKFIERVIKWPIFPI